MTNEAEYRANAANSIELANRASSMRDKGRLLAEKWLDLAIGPTAFTPLHASRLATSVAALEAR